MVQRINKNPASFVLSPGLEYGMGLTCWVVLDTPPLDIISKSQFIAERLAGVPESASVNFSA